MPNVSHLAILSLAMWTTLPLSCAQQEVVLPEGTPVRLRIMHTLSSATAQEGNKVDFQTIDDVSSGGIVVIPKGATAMATITDAEPKKRMARGGKLSINIDYVRLPNNEKISLRGVQNLKGGGHTGAMTAGMVATAIVVWPAAPFFLFMHGKDITIPEGQESVVYTNSDYKAALPGASTEAPLGDVTPIHKSGATLTNADVIKLKTIGLSDELIIQRIRMSAGNYKLEPDDLADLKKASISDSVISAMMTAASKQ